MSDSYFNSMLTKSNHYSLDTLLENVLIFLFNNTLTSTSHVLLACFWIPLWGLINVYFQQ